LTVVLGGFLESRLEPILDPVEPEVAEVVLEAFAGQLFHTTPPPDSSSYSASGR